MDALLHIDVPRDVLESARLTVEEARMELAIHLYATGRLGFAKARKLADIPLGPFRHMLAARGIAVQYDVADLEEDLATLDRLIGA